MQRWSNLLFTRRASRTLSRWRPLSQTRGLLTLAIETSCDDTAVAIVEKLGSRGILHFNKKVTSDNSQYGGIHPILAQESHEKHLSALLVEAWDMLKNQSRQPDFISVTRGPGMYHNLREGLATAKGISVASGIPILGVHHMQAHACTPRLACAMEENEKGSLTPEFPFLTLLVSGGHSMLVRSENLTAHAILATTGDTAVGNCIDHVAKVILPREVFKEDHSKPMGAKLEHFAFPSNEFDYVPPILKPKKKASYFTRSSDMYTWRYPVPFDTSRGGKKTKAMEYSFASIRGFAEQLVTFGWDHETNKLKRTARESLAISEEELRCIARDAMRVAFEQLASRAVMALESERQLGDAPSKTLVVSGGVAANSFLKHVLRNYLDAAGFDTVQTIFPPISLCTDNAAMIGWTGCEMWEAGYASPLSVLPTSKWSLEDLLCESDVYTRSSQQGQG